MLLVFRISWKSDSCVLERQACRQAFQSAYLSLYFPSNEYIHVEDCRGVWRAVFGYVPCCLCRPTSNNSHAVFGFVHLHTTTSKRPWDKLTTSFQSLLCFFGGQPLVIMELGDHVHEDRELFQRRAVGNDAGTNKKHATKGVETRREPQHHMHVFLLFCHESWAWCVCFE